MLQDHRSKGRGESSRASYLPLQPNRESAMGEKYRVCAYVEDHETRLGMCRVGTDDNGAVRCVSVASTEVFATLDELKEGLERMRAACELPVLTVTDESQMGDVSTSRSNYSIRSRLQAPFFWPSQRPGVASGFSAS